MKFKHIAAWLALALVLLGLWTWQAWQEETTSATRAAVGTSSAAVDNFDLRVDAWASDSRIVTGEPLQVSVTIYNPTDADVFVRFARFQHPGFGVANTGCWERDIPRCTDHQGTPRPVALPLRVGSHQSATFVPNLTAGRERGRYAIAGIVAWGAKSNDLNRRKPVTLRPIAVDGRVQNAVLIFLRAFQSFVKDLALPLALAFLGFWLKKQEEVRSAARKAEEDARAAARKADEDARAEQRRLDDDARAQRRREDEEARAQTRREDEQARENARRQEEEARLEQRKAAAEKNAQTQQTWNLMLLKSHQNAERHYMVMGTAARRIAQYWRAGKDDLCFFSYLLFLSRIRRMIRAIGGFYFKSRDGEATAKMIWSFIVERSDDIFTRDLRDRSTMALPPHFSYADYRDSVADKVQPMKKVFDENKTLFAPLVPLFEAVALVLEYEMNKPYEHWYQQVEKFNSKEGAAIIQRLRAEADGAEFTALTATFEAYANRSAAASRGAEAATELTVSEGGE
jgi:hypothetical protein